MVENKDEYLFTLICLWSKDFRKALNALRKLSEAVVRRWSVKKVFVEISQKLTGKHLCQRFFFNKVAGLRPATLLEKSLWRRCFPMNFAKFLKTPFFTEHLRWLFLNFHKLWYRKGLWLKFLETFSNLLEVWISRLNP